MLIGNQNYDRVTKGVPQYFSVREGVSNLSFLGSVTIGSELPVSIMDETVPSASLLHHLKLSLNSTSKTAYLFILGGKRHSESNISCPRTQHNVSGQGLNLNYLI